MNLLKGYLGTYASPESLGIYQFSLDTDTGNLTIPTLYYAAADSKYLSLRHGVLASSISGEGKAGVCLLDTSGSEARKTGSAFHEHNSACYVTQDDDYLCTANYHEGTILIFRKQDGVPELLKRIEIGVKAGCHQILFHEHYMMVPCLLLDKIVLFDCDQDFAPAGEILFSKGTGPRHGIFDKQHKRFFLVSELSNELYVYRVLPGLEFQLEQVCSFLPEAVCGQEASASAAVRLSPDERFLYLSTRFAELICVFRLEGNRVEPIQQTGCGGSHPRDFILTPKGDYLLVVNRLEGGLVCFRLDQDSGKLLEICSRVPAPEAVCIVFE